MDPDIYGFVVVVAAITGFVAAMAAIAVGTKMALQRTKPRVLAPVSDERFERLELAVDAIAIEIERMSEAQRFTAKILTERSSALPNA